MAGTRVDGKVIPDLDGALHSLDDEDDGDQAGEALLREPRDVADKEAGEKEVKSELIQKLGPGIRGNEYDEHGGKPEADPDAKGEVFPAKPRAKLVNLKVQLLISSLVLVLVGVIEQFSFKRR